MNFFISFHSLLPDETLRQNLNNSPYRQSRLLYNKLMWNVGQVQSSVTLCIDYWIILFLSIPSFFDKCSIPSFLHFHESLEVGSNSKPHKGIGLFSNRESFYSQYYSFKCVCTFLSNSSSSLLFGFFFFFIIFLLLQFRSSFSLVC